MWRCPTGAAAAWRRSTPTSNRAHRSLHGPRPIWISSAPSSNRANNHLPSLLASLRIGIDKLGIWSVSRGGWIPPLTIERNRNVDFWISVSGPSNVENFPYMLETSIRLDGRGPEQARKARAAGLAAQRLVDDPDVSCDTYIRETHAMFEAPWFERLIGEGPPSREAL